MKVAIIKSSNSRWYRNMVGEIVEVYTKEGWGGTYLVSNLTETQKSKVVGEYEPLRITKGHYGIMKDDVDTNLFLYLVKKTFGGIKNNE